jgi:hypothetical protein
MEAKAQAHPERMETLLGLREVTEVCPENSKAGPEEIVAVLGANLGVTDAIVQQLELCKEAKVDTIKSLED